MLCKRLLGLGPSQIFWLFFIIGLGLRLPVLTEPRQVVFDEIYFSNFATSYCCDGSAFFDIHPPHGKLLIGAVARIFGQEERVQLKGIGVPYLTDTAVFGLRLVPAVAGALIPSLVALIIIQLGGSILVGLLGGFLLTFDNALWVQSRIIAIDPILIAAMLGAVSASLAAMRRHETKDRVLLLLLSGACAGLALGSKFTGLACLPAIMILLAMSAYSSKGKRLSVFIRQIIWFGSGFTLIYLSGWWLHFQLLSKPGPGDAFFRPSGNFLLDVADLHKIMFLRNAEIKNLHPYASLWYSWPLMLRPVFYWSSGPKQIYLLGNPVVWYSVLTGFFLGSWFWARDVFRNLKNVLEARAWLPLSLCAVSFLPLVMVSRPLFLYHYFPTLVFETIFACLAMQTVLQACVERSPRFKYAGWIFAALVIIGFITFIPMTAGVSWGSEYRNWVFQLLPNWR